MSLEITTSAQVEALDGVLTSMSDDLSSTGLSLCYNSVVDFEIVGRTARAVLRPQALREMPPVSLPRSHTQRAIGNLHTLVLQSWKEIDSQALSCFCSVLPSTRSLQALHLEADDSGPSWMLSEASSSGLAYAIFHPQTKHSTWKKLLMKSCRFSNSASPVIAARRLNPIALLSVARLAAVMKPGRYPFLPFAADVVEHESLQIAQVVAWTVVRREPAVTSPSLSVVIGADDWLQVGDRQSSGWYRAIIPGFEFG